MRIAALKTCCTLLLTLSAHFALAADPASCEQQKGKVLRAMFTTKLENREPSDRVLILGNDVTELFFYSDLSQLDGHTITHRWEYEGKVVYQRSYEVKGSRWRITSRKDLDPSMVGRWTVVIVDEKECPLKAVVFQYMQHSETNNPAAILPP
jgi:hypothetical protein